MDAVFHTLGSAPALTTLCLLVFLMAVRSPWPWTRAGGVVLAVVVLGVLGWAAWRPESRRFLAEGERLPLLVFVLASGAVAWAGLHRLAEGRGDDEGTAAWSGFAPAELGLSGVVVLGAAVVAVVRGAPLLAMADPARPELARPPWFLSGLHEMRAYFDPWVAGLALPALLLAGLVALPFVDPPQAETGEKRRVAVPFFLFTWGFLVLLPMVLAVLDGAGPGAGRPLSEAVWGWVLERPPEAIWLRELPGVLLLGLYFLLPPRLLPHLRSTRVIFGRYRRSLGRGRFYAAVILALLFLLVPIRMYGRWLFGIGAVVHLGPLP